MSKRVRPGAKAVIEKDGKILALKTEASGETYHVLPGGKIEYGESHEEALEREIQEEISCSAKAGEVLGTYHFFTGPQNNGDQVVLTVFRADIRDQEIDISDNPADENIVEASWLRPEEFIERTDNESLKKFLKSISRERSSK